MKTLIAAVLLQLLFGNPLPSGGSFERAIQNYRLMLNGRMQLHQLSPQERADVQELDRWLRSAEPRRKGETATQCKERLASSTPTPLEEALLDLKCSQRPRR